MSAVTKPTFVAGPSRHIFRNVCKAMQDAEEIWGPGEEHYPDLMDAIIAECRTRKANCLQLWVDEHARAASLLMDMVPIDSFGPIDAVRALPDYGDMTGDQREAITRALRAMIDGGSK